MVSKTWPQEGTVHAAWFDADATAVDGEAPATDDTWGRRIDQRGAASGYVSTWAMKYRNLLHGAPDARVVPRGRADAQPARNQSEGRGRSAGVSCSP